MINWDLRVCFKFSIILLTILTGEDDRGRTEQKTGISDRKSLDREEHLEILSPSPHLIVSTILSLK